MRHSRSISKIEEALSELGIMDRVSGHTMDLFKIAVMEAFENTHLPELFGVIGIETFLKVLDIFENSEFTCCPHCDKSLKWPAKEKFLLVLQDVAIYCRLSKAAKGLKAKTTRELAAQYDTTPGKIRTAFLRMERRSKRYEFLEV